MSLAPAAPRTEDRSEPRVGRRRAERGPALAWGVLGVLAVGLAWWALTAVGGAGSPMLAALDPLGVPAALASLLSTGVLLQDLVTSTLRLLLGMGIAAAVGGAVWAIARAIANSPRLLLADEPTGNLDPRTADHVFEALTHIVRATGLAALVATHNLELAARMDRRVTLREGQVVELD